MIFHMDIAEILIAALIVVMMVVTVVESLKSK
jgi:hypothetical protein